MPALVIRGPGPTWHYIINGLLKRAKSVTMLHSGKHEIPEIPQDVVHVHADAYSADSFRKALDSRAFE